MVQTKMQNDLDMANLKETVKNIEKGHAFISREFESQKEKIKELINDNKKIHMETEKLNSNLRQMEQKLMENRDTVNELNQYSRS